MKIQNGIFGIQNPLFPQRFCNLQYDYRAVQKCKIKIISRVCLLNVLSYRAFLVFYLGVLCDSEKELIILKLEIRNGN